MEKYNAIPHTKIPNVKNLNEDLRRLIEYGHKKERETVDNLFDKGLMIDLLTDYLSLVSEKELSHVLSVIVRETKNKKSKNN